MAESPKYVVVQEKIKEWILNGQVKPGEKIYSENELVKLFRVSRHTVRQAIRQLVNEGWLYTEQGSGTFCADRNFHEIRQKPSSGNTKTIGVITTYISDYIFPSILNGIESYLTEKGYSLVLASTDNDPKKEKQCLETLMSREIDGLIVEPTKSSGFNPNVCFYTELERLHIPYIMINQFYQQLNPPHLIVDDERGTYMVTEHLIRLGHSKIAGLFKTDDLQGVYRMKGYLNALRENHVPFFQNMVKTYSTENMNQMIEDYKVFLKNTKERPSAIVCYNDQMAIEVIRVLRELDIKIPQDISITGFDDSNLAVASEIKLTTVTHPKTQMGIDAAKWIVAAVEKVENHYEKSRNSIIYEPVLIVRNSTLDKKDAAEKSNIH
ncbi:GntR family transcriptional regulator [Heyndrickxia faecalis]|uniref:GntR family transcriptional regulator n=1 Tax=Heyndrickxia faecalis TaxID=2824910 RepID=UPI003D236A24